MSPGSSAFQIRKVSSMGFGGSLVWTIVVVIGCAIPFTGAQEPELSPAGGNYLDLSEGYYLAEDNPSLDALLGNEWTIEFWIYPKRIPPPPPDSELRGSPMRAAVSVIIEKAGSYVVYLASYYAVWGKGKDWLVDWAFTKYVEEENIPILQIQVTSLPEVGQRKVINMPVIEPGKWHYMVFQQEGRKTLISIDGKWCYEGELKGWEKVDTLDSDRPFYLGGRALDEPFVEPVWIRVALPRIVPTEAMIDELRISDIARYHDMPPIPKGGFASDLHTLALWHFDEPPRSLRYEDSSGNGNILISGRAFDVIPGDKLITTWGRIRGEP
ncbi:hypothetical protein J7M22_18250 [Candidatus Poribacteria bacterium]|nr:hypothetical protein [Candidatus Poribacteria bacterium]